MQPFFGGVAAEVVRYEAHACITGRRPSTSPGPALAAWLPAFVTEKIQQKPAYRELREPTIIYHKRRNGMEREGEYLRVQGGFQGRRKRRNLSGADGGRRGLFLFIQTVSPLWFA